MFFCFLKNVKSVVAHWSKKVPLSIKWPNCTSWCVGNDEVKIAFILYFKMNKISKCRFCFSFFYYSFIFIIFNIIIILHFSAKQLNITVTTLELQITWWGRHWYCSTRLLSLTDKNVTMSLGQKINIRSNATNYFLQEVNM